MAAGFSVKDALNRNSKAGIEEYPKARFRTKDISIFKMYRNRKNFYSMKDIEELAGEILTCGLKQNLEVIYAPCDEGEYRIVAGERRWEALKYLVSKGYAEFEIATAKLTSPQDADEEQVEIIIANAYRVKSVMDMIEEEKRLKESLGRMKASNKKIKGYDLQSGRLRDVIASMLRISKTKVAQIETINNNLIPQWKEELKMERLTFSAAYELSGMSPERQKEVLSEYMESGEITYKDIKGMKDNLPTEAEHGLQMESTKGQQSDEQPVSDFTKNREDSKVSECDTEESEAFDEMGSPEKGTASDTFETPHPEGITSLCYSCTEYETCNVKTGTCTKCDQYRNRKEAYKTDEQRYSEEQAKIDKETKKKIQEMKYEEKMNNITQRTQARGNKVHQIKIGASYFKDVCTGTKNFELRKNDRDYRIGDILEMREISAGKETGRKVSVLVTYILEGYIGIDDDYCIMAISPINEDGEKLQYADINQICADIRANGDGYMEAGEEIILVDKAVGLVRGKGLI